MDGKVHRANRGAFRPLAQFETDESKRLNVLLANQLLKIYSTEKLQVSFLAKLKTLTSNTLIVDVIEDQFADTQQHLKRLERVFSLMQLAIPQKINSLDTATQLMMKEGKKAVNAVKAYPYNSDRVIILEIQKVSHYKMANYMNLGAWAKNLQLDDISELLEDTLDDIVNADLSLSQLSEACINHNLFE